MIAFAEQMQRLESTFLQLMFRNLSVAADRVGHLSEVEGERLLKGQEEIGAAVRTALHRQPAHARAKANPSRAGHKSQPKRRRKH